MPVPTLRVSDSDRTRSPAAAHTAKWADISGLFFAHFEHRHALPTPASWCSGKTAEAPRFVGGVLPEPKYQSFRHDLLVASFHPGHRAKWTAHELCHGLVGFAYRPGATRMFHAVAAWLAELLPVTLWYFFDEAGLERCTHHQSGGPIFQQQCEACERAAADGPRKLGPEDLRHVRDGQAFLDRELAAIARSRRLGRPRGGVHASIDLASDGLAYAASHAARLAAPEMERYVAQFFGPGQGHHATLDELEARVVAVARGLSGGRPAQPWQATRWDYAAQDVSYRLLSLGARAGDDVARELSPLIDTLANKRTARGLSRCIADYEALWNARPRKRGAALVAPELLFAVGYPLPGGHGSALVQLSEGVASACPNAFTALGRRARDVVSAFAQADRPERSPIGRRFARFLSRAEPGAVAELAAVEAAITHVRPRDPFAAQLDPHETEDPRVRLSSAVEVVNVHHDVLGMPVARLKRITRKGERRALLVSPATTGEVDVMELPVLVATRLARAAEEGVVRDELGLDDETIDGLLDAQVLVPVAYAE